MTIPERSVVTELWDLDRHRLALATGLGLLSAAYLSWLVADLGLRWVGFVLGWVGVGWYLTRRTDRRDLVVAWLRIDAVLLLLTPLFLNLPFLLNAARFDIGNVSGFVLTASDLVALLLFGLLAAVTAGIGYWLDRSNSGTSG